MDTKIFRERQGVDRLKTKTCQDKSHIHQTVISVSSLCIYLGPSSLPCGDLAPLSVYVCAHAHVHMSVRCCVDVCWK